VSHDSVKRSADTTRTFQCWSLLICTESALYFADPHVRMLATALGWLTDSRRASIRNKISLR